MTYPGYDFDKPADPDLYSRVIEASFEAEERPAHYEATLAQYEAAESARRSEALGFILV